MREQTLLGQRLPKVDGLERVTGKAAYGADIALPGMLHGRILRSPHPHAVIRRIDYGAALRLPGVVAVITARDLSLLAPAAHKEALKTIVDAEPEAYDPGHEGEAISSGRPASATTVFAREKVIWAGQPVAAVAASSPHIAEEALGLIKVDYEILPAALTAEEAMKPDAPLVHPNLFTETLGVKATKPSNIATHIELSRGDVEKGFREADATIEDTFRTRTIHQGYIEPRATAAKVEPDGKITVWTSSQGSFNIQGQLSEIFHLPLSMINVVPMEIGGGFGSKGQGVLEPVCLLLAMKTGRAVKMVNGRDEEFKAGRPGAASVIHLKMGAKKDGKLTAAVMEVIMDAGAFPGGPVAAATNVGIGQYKIPNLHITGYDVITNKPPVGAYRAPGVPQATFAVESQMNRLAEALKIDPLEFRLMNVSEEGDRLPTDVVLPRIGFKETLLKVKQDSAWTRKLAGLNRGRGIACGMWMGGIQPNSATLRVNSDGTLALIVGTVDLTGVRTSFVQMVAHEFGVSPVEVTVSTGDTDSAPYASNSGGSKTTYTMSVAIKKACDEVKAQLMRRAAAQLDVPLDQVEYQPYRIQVKRTPDRFVTIAELAKAGISGTGPIIGTGVSARLRQAPSFGAHVVDVEVDPETGKVTLLNYTTFQDCGFAINPTQVEGQMQGGASQGIGWALTEEYVFDNGVMRNPTFLDYRMPTALDLPLIETRLVEVPSPDSPYGVRGVGEVPIVPPMAAIANAIYDAVKVRLNELPMSPENVLLAMQKKNGPDK